jgi:transcription antitermination factor NusG
VARKGTEELSLDTASYILTSPDPVVIGEQHDEKWYAVHTRARHERAVALRLGERGVTTFLPTIKEVHRWNDRKKTVELPLFGCYLFVKLMPRNEERQRVLRTDSVLGLVGATGVGTPIPDEQIDAVRILVSERLPYHYHPFLKTGQRVRIRGGALEGLEGIFLSRHGEKRLVISVDAMQRSLAIQVEGYEVEPL